LPLPPSDALTPRENGSSTPAGLKQPPSGVSTPTVPGGFPLQTWKHSGVAGASGKAEIPRSLLSVATPARQRLQVRTVEAPPARVPSMSPGPPQQQRGPVRTRSQSPAAASLTAPPPSRGPSRAPSPAPRLPQGLPLEVGEAPPPRSGRSTPMPPSPRPGTEQLGAWLPRAMPSWAPGTAVLPKTAAGPCVAHRIPGSYLDARPRATPPRERPQTVAAPPQRPSLETAAVPVSLAGLALRPAASPRDVSPVNTPRGGIDAGLPVADNAAPTARCSIETAVPSLEVVTPTARSSIETAVPPAPTARSSIETAVRPTDTARSSVATSVPPVDVLSRTARSSIETTVAPPTDAVGWCRQRSTSTDAPEMQRQGSAGRPQSVPPRGAFDSTNSEPSHAPRPSALPMTTLGKLPRQISGSTLPAETSMVQSTSTGSRSSTTSSAAAAAAAAAAAVMAEAHRITLSPESLAKQSRTRRGDGLRFAWNECDVDASSTLQQDELHASLLKGLMVEQSGMQHKHLQDALASKRSSPLTSSGGPVQASDTDVSGEFPWVIPQMPASFAESPDKLFTRFLTAVSALEAHNAFNMLMKCAATQSRSGFGQAALRPYQVLAGMPGLPWRAQSV